MNKTQELLAQALTHPQLQEPGGCKYFDEQGNSCIAGTVLRLCGASDDTLRNAAQNFPITSKYANRELTELANRAELDVDLLREAQLAWDSASRDTVPAAKQRSRELVAALATAD